MAAKLQVKWNSQAYAASTWETVAFLAKLPAAAAAIDAYHTMLRTRTITPLTFQQQRAAQQKRKQMLRAPFDGSEVFSGGKKLMTYQVSGANWLALNYHQKRSSLLADEMVLDWLIANRVVLHLRF